MTLEATVSLGWVNTVFSAAERLGVDSSRLLSAAGIPMARLDEARWPIDDITRLWHAAEHCTGDTGLGLKAGMAILPVNMGSVGFALQSAATLREAFAMVQKYLPLISDGGRFQMLAGEGATWVVYHPRQGQLAFSPHQLEAVLAAVIALSGWISGCRLQPLRVQFSQTRLGPLKGYQDAFGCPAFFEQAFSGLLLDNALLDAPLPQADARLARVHEAHTAAHLAALGQKNITAASLRQWLLINIGPPLPKRPNVAKALGVSERTLSRRLKEQGESFESLLDDVRRELAFQMVSDRHQALADVAQTLGFAEPSTFYRAFRRWTGMAPARWRRQRLSA